MVEKEVVVISVEVDHKSGEVITKSETVIIEQGKRTRCPFYGFHYGMGMLIDQEGNQCALITDSYSPCQFVRCSVVPDWNTCPFSTNEKFREVLPNIRKQVRVFPGEFGPKSGPWTGITLSEWMDFILLGKAIDSSSQSSTPLSQVGDFVKRLISGQ